MIRRQMLPFSTKRFSVPSEMSCTLELPMFFFPLRVMCRTVTTGCTVVMMCIASAYRYLERKYPLIFFFCKEMIASISDGAINFTESTKPTKIF